MFQTGVNKIPETLTAVGGGGENTLKIYPFGG